MSQTDLTVHAGAIVAFRLFDIAYAIDLARAEALWTARARAASRSRLTLTPPKAMAFDVPPLTLALDPVILTVSGADVAADVRARLYDFGAISLALRVPVSGTEWQAFVQRVNMVDACLAQEQQTRLWEDILDQVRNTLAPALIRPEPSRVQEDFLIGAVYGLSEELTAAALLDRVDLVPLLSGEQRVLSDGTRRDLLRQRFSYFADDLVVLTWDRAFIYEPRGDSDVMDVLEVANAQLLEMRYYDELLDAELPRMYGLVETARRQLAPLASRRFANLARRLHALVAEVTELTERVDNALQVTEDVYLARVYSAALEQYRVAALSASVNRKLAIIRDTYTALYDEASASRAELLEFLILMLILAEIILGLLRL